MSPSVASDVPRRKWHGRTVTPSPRAPADAIRFGRSEDAARYPIIEREAAKLYAPWGLYEVLMTAATAPERVTSAIAREDLLVAVDPSDVAIGYALLDRDAGDLHLEELAVHPDHGRRGLGSALLHATVLVARARGARRVTLVTLDFVPFGKSFYEPRGFHVLTRAERTPAIDAIVPPDADDGRIAMALDLARR